MKIKKTTKTTSLTLIPFAAVFFAFLVGSIFIMFVGKNPFEAYYYLFKGAFGSISSLGETIVKVTPLIFTSLAAVVSYRCGMYNLGAEGQFIMGAIAAVWFSTTVTFVVPLIRIIISMLFGALAGMLWGAIPGLLRTYHNTNEMIITILLNQIAILFMAFLYSGPLKEANIPQTKAVEEAGRLMRFIPGTRAHTGIFIGLLLAIIVFYVLFYTYKGYQFRVVGLNSIAARVNGFAVKRYMIGGFLISGAVAGLGGSIEVLGTAYRLQSGFGTGFGFDGVAVALIAQLHPLGAVLVAYLFAVLKCGANSMQVATGITTAVIDMIKAVIILFSIIGTALVSLCDLKIGFPMGRKMKKEELRAPNG
jgi:ABC-type uncharacterized transport system permease subunit